MLVIISSVIMSIMLFLCAFLGYKEGLRIGIQASKGIEPEKIQTPIQIVKNVIKEVKQTKSEHEQAKEEKKYQENLERLMNYTGDIDEE